jgi:hypothetical protein
MGDDRSAGAAPADRDQALRLEHPQRFPQRGAGHAELGGQLLFDGQALALGQLAAQDLAPQLVGHDHIGLLRPGPDAHS